VNPDTHTLPFCSVIIVNYNGKHLLHDCLTAVLSQSYGRFEVIVVDNASKDGSADFLRARFPAVTLVALDETRGFAGGNNEGARRAQGDLLVLLNNDAIAGEGWLSALVEAVAPPSVAVAGSLIRTEGIPERYYERNGSFNFLGHNIMRKYRLPENTFFAGGASLIFKRAIIGMPFDDDYFLYLEDVYLSFRARFLGFRVVQTAASHVRHLGSETTRREQPSLMTMYQERNRLLNMLLFFKAWTILKLLPLFAANAVAKLIASLLFRRYSLAGLLRAYAWLALHPSAIAEKRRALRPSMRASERDVTEWMTSDLTNGESAPGRVINALAHLYFRLAGIRTLEDMPPGSR
jgi:GT2 family glycosyltransferase